MSSNVWFVWSRKILRGQRNVYVRQTLKICLYLLRSDVFVAKTHMLMLKHRMLIRWGVEARCVNETMLQLVATHMSL